MLRNALLRGRNRAGESSPGNDNSFLVSVSAPDSQHAARATAVAERFRALSALLIVASIAVAIGMEAVVRVRVAPGATYILDWVLAALLTLSLLWWDRAGMRRISDALGVFGMACLGGMSCGAIAMLELRLHFPIADPMLRSWDLTLGIDGLAVIERQLEQGDWLMALMALAYNRTLQLFFGGVVVLALFGDRVEAWRAAFCFVGSLLSTCMIALFVPAKGLGVWAEEEMFHRLPAHAMRNFWPHFDDFYFGTDPVLQLQAIDGVISFPSFHTVVGFLVLAMWRKRLLTLIPAATWLFFMLLATLPGGGHYIVDLIGGFGVWAAWFALSRRIERQAAARLEGSVPAFTLGQKPTLRADSA